MEIDVACMHYVGQGNAWHLVRMTLPLTSTLAAADACSLTLAETPRSMVRHNRSVIATKKRSYKPRTCSRSSRFSQVGKQQCLLSMLITRKI